LECLGMEEILQCMHRRLEITILMGKGDLVLFVVVYCLFNVEIFKLNR
jgi:hypothetical protein